MAQYISKPLHYVLNNEKSESKRTPPDLKPIVETWLRGLTFKKPASTKIEFLRKQGWRYSLPVTACLCCFYGIILFVFFNAIACPQAKRIKICTGAQLKKMCPPPPCPCPPKIPRPSLLMRLARLLGFGVKSALALGAVYVTYDLGIWGDSKTTGELYQRVCKEILPILVEPPKAKQLSPPCQAEAELFNLYEKDPFCCDKFPIDHESGMYELQQKWNKIVSTTFSNLAKVPIHLGNLTLFLYCKLTGTEEGVCEDVKLEDDDGECCPCEDDL